MHRPMNGPSRIYTRLFSAAAQWRRALSVAQPHSELLEAGAESNVAYAALISVLMRDPEFLIY